MKAYLWNVGGNGLAMMINFIFGILLARIISPEYYGVFILLIIPIQTFHSLFIFMLRAYLFQQTASLNSLINSKSFYQFYSLLYALLYILIGYGFLKYFNHIELFWECILILAPTQILLSNFTIDQINSEIENRFDFINIIRIISTFLCNLIAYFIALKGYLLLALSIRFLLYYLFTAIGYKFNPRIIRVTALVPHLPGLIHYIKTLGILESFNVFISHIDDILIGIFLGDNNLGLYNKSFNIFIAPTKHITDRIYETALPQLSHSEMDDAFMSSVKINSIIQHCMIPFLLFFWMNCEDIVYISLGEHWLSTIPLLKWFILATILHQNSFIKSLMIAQNKNRELRKFSIISQLIILLGIVIGIQFGIEQVAKNYFISAIIVFSFLIYSLKLKLPNGIRLCFSFLFIPIFIGILTNIPQYFIEFGTNIWSLGLKLLVSIVVWYSIHSLFPKLIKNSILNLIRLN